MTYLMRGSHVIYKKLSDTSRIYNKEKILYFNNNIYLIFQRFFCDEHR